MTWDSFADGPLVASTKGPRTCLACAPTTDGGSCFDGPSTGWPAGTAMTDAAYVTTPRVRTTGIARAMSEGVAPRHQRTRRSRNAPGTTVLPSTVARADRAPHGAPGDGQ